MNFNGRQGQVALVAGASEGLGAAFARALASRGFDIIMVARRHELLKALAIEIERRYGVKAYPITCDLGNPGALDLIRSEIRDLDVNVLVYNAAKTTHWTLLKHHRRVLTAYAAGKAFARVLAEGVVV